MAVKARERLLSAARELFYAEGIRAVGVERLLEESGVGRASFYRHFASKDELVAATLDEYDVEYRSWLRARVAELGNEPLAVFEAAAQRAEQTRYRGCAFVNSLAEITDPDDPVHARVGIHKSAVTHYLTDLLTTAGVENSGQVAARWMLLLDGAGVTASYTHDTTAFTHAKHIAARDLTPAAEPDVGVKVHRS